MEPPRLLADEALGARTYHGLRRKHIDTYLDEFVFGYNRRFYRHVSFETMLGLAARHEPANYWDIIKKDNCRKARRPLAQKPIAETNHVQPQNVDVPDSTG